MEESRRGSGCLPVSVIVPCYNCADVVGRAVESVVGQSWLPAEVVLVDDASSDNGETLERLRAFQKKYAGRVKIEVISLDVNGGPSVARNAGWNVATRPYVAFLDADDSWHPRKLEIQYGWMSSHPEVDVCGHLCMWEGISRPSDFLSINEMTVHPVTRQGLLIRNAFSTPTVMLKRELPYRFPEGMKYAEDYYLWLCLACHGLRIACLDVPLAVLHKAPFGAGGLSGNLWAMELGVQTALRRLRRQGLLNPLECWLAQGFSFLKYLRRFIAARYRNGFAGGGGCS